MNKSELKLKTILDWVNTIEKNDKHIVEYLMAFGNIQISIKTSTN